jgi:hypothetical protein
LEAKPSDGSGSGTAQSSSTHRCTLRFTHPLFGEEKGDGDHDGTRPKHGHYDGQTQRNSGSGVASKRPCTAATTAMVHPSHQAMVRAIAVAARRVQRLHSADLAKERPSKVVRKKRALPLRNSVAAPTASGWVTYRHDGTTAAPWLSAATATPSGAGENDMGLNKGQSGAVSPTLLLLLQQNGGPAAVRGPARERAPAMAREAREVALAVTILAIQKTRMLHSSVESSVESFKEELL